MQRLARYPNLVVLRTFSKAYALAGFRVGYAVGPAYILDAARSVAIPFAVTEPAQRAAVAALADEDWMRTQVAQIVARRDRIRDALRAQGWTLPEPQGNYVWLETGADTAAAAEVFERHGIVARVFPPEGIRITVGEEDAVERLLQAAAEVVQTLSTGH
jgi:histidinol-phosphate aminotransferase